MPRPHAARRPSVSLSNWPLVLLPALACAASSARAATIAVSGPDGASVQAAVEKASGGDTVQVPAGTYALAETLKGKSGVRLVGAGAEKTIHGQRRDALLLAHGPRGLATPQQGGQARLVPDG